MTSKEFEFTNGDRVKEKITGFTGVITGTCFYLTGCNQYLITAESKDNKNPVALWYDEGRIELLNKAEVKIEDVKAVDNGCDLLPDVGLKGN